MRRRQGVAIEQQLAKERELKPVRHHQRLGAAFWATCQEQQRAALFVGQLRHCTAVRLSRGGCSLHLGRASAPTIPQLVQTMRGPNVGTATSSG
jgi:hypothetical protein